MSRVGLSALAMAHFSRLRGLHRGHDGFAWLLMGLLAIGVAVWAVSRGERIEPAKN